MVDNFYCIWYSSYINNKTMEVVMPENQCEQLEYGECTCSEMYNCCDCGGVDCGCPYCWSCNACATCLNQE